MTTARGGGRPPNGLAEMISREMVRIMRDAAGRGPTKARTTIGRDHVLVMFEGTLTRGERNLVEHGKAEDVEAVRAGYQEIVRKRATELVEGALGRKVRGFMSANHFEPDLAAEVFVLEPLADSSSARAPEEGEHSEDGSPGGS